MVKGENIILEDLKNKGRCVYEICISQKNLEKKYEKPPIEKGFKLIAYSDVFPDEGGIIEDVTTNKAFQNMINKNKKGRLGEYLGELDPVFVSFHLLPQQNNLLKTTF